MTKSSVSITFVMPTELKKRLKYAARQQRRSLSNMLRVILEEALEFYPAPQAILERSEYDIWLTVAEAASLVKQGYNVQAL